MHVRRRTTLLLISVLLALMFGPAPTTPVAYADGFIDFEDGADGEPIRSTIPGLQFTTTAGYDWIYGDWRTGQYNRSYHSNGNFFAWLGPNQGAGRIDFTESGASYIQVWVSSLSGLYADGYDGMNNKIATASVGGNLDTGSMLRLRVDAPAGKSIAYVVFHDTGNYWLIDDLSTDAAGVPVQRPPVIVIPGIMGSELDYYNTATGNDAPAWPPMYDPDAHTIDLTGIVDVGELVSRLLPLRLSADGVNPWLPIYRVYSTAVLNDVKYKAVFTLAEQHPYGLLIQALRDAGYTVYEYDYDWRMDVQTAPHGQGKDGTTQDLDAYIDWVLGQTGATKVNIVAHSLGGLVARAYVSASTAHAAKVEQAIILGTPYLGAPQVMAGLRSGFKGTDEWYGQIPYLDIALKDLVQNYASVYQVVPSKRYWDVAGNWFFKNGSSYSWSELQQLLNTEHNSQLTPKANALHDVVDDWSSLPEGVAFRFIAGSGLENTPAGFREEERSSKDGGTRWDVVPGNGDGTVPVESASLEGNGASYRGSVPIWYAKDVDHGSLTQKDYILDFIVAMLATPPNAAAEGAATATATAEASRTDARGQPMPLGQDGAANPENLLYRGTGATVAAPRQVVTAPPIPPQMSVTPFPLDGAQITVYQAAAVHVYDTAGRHTGPTSGGSVELGIPGSSYETAGSGTFVTVPAGSVYRTQITPFPDTSFDVRVRDVQGTTKFIQRTLLFDGVAVPAAGKGMMSVNPDNLDTATHLDIDGNGDGKPETSLPPNEDLGPGPSYDFEPPQASIAASGNRNARGWYTGSVRITISVADSLSGVKGVQYSLDGGRSFTPYQGPFYVTAELSPVITADAWDHADNHRIAKLRLVPALAILPLVAPPGSSPTPDTWSPTSGLAGRFVLDLASTDGSCGTVFSATEAGVYRSVDGGLSWQFLFAPAAAASEPRTREGDEERAAQGREAGAASGGPTFGGPTFEVHGVGPDADLATSVAVCAADPAVIYAGGWGSGVYRSSNGGNTWQPRAGGLSDPWVYDLAVAPNNCDLVFAATSSGGVFKSSNGGNTWQASNSGLGNLLTRSLALGPATAPGNPSRVYAGTGAAPPTGGVYRSDNAGGSWIALGNQLPDAPVWGLAASPADPNVLYAGLDGAGVYRWQAGQGAWEPASVGLGPGAGAGVKVRSLIVDPLAPSTLYVGRDDGGGVYRSLNGGGSWTAFNSGLGSRIIKALWLDGGSCRRLLAGSSDGVWRSAP